MISPFILSLSKGRPEQHRAKSRGVSKGHNLDVIKTADWVLDLGPGGGVNGGEIVVAGEPETVAACEASFTGQYLRPLLERVSGLEPVLSKEHAPA